MANKNEIKDEKLSCEDILTRSEEIEYNIKELKKTTKKLNAQRAEIQLKMKEYDEERKKMIEFIKNLPNTEGVEEQLSLFDDEEDDEEYPFDDDFDDYVYDIEFINDLKVALFELNMAIDNDAPKHKIKCALQKVNSVVYEYENNDPFEGKDE